MKTKTRLLLIMAFALVGSLMAGLLTGCGGQTATTPTTGQTSGPPPASSTGTTTPAGTSPAVTTKPATQPPTTPATTTSSPAGQLLLTITSPADGAVVGVANVTITGQTAPNATVSVNGDIVDTDASGKFSAPVTLEEGPNVFDVIATDPDGNEASTQIVISYAP